MSQKQDVQGFLGRYEVGYQVVPHAPTETLEQAADAAGIPAAQVVRAVLMKDAVGPMLAILPLQRMLDFAALKEMTAREAEPVSGASAKRLFENCESRCIPPLGAAYGIPVVVDNAIREFDAVYMEPGSHSMLMLLETEDFIKVQGPRAQWGDFSCAQEALPEVTGFPGLEGLEVPEDSEFSSRMRNLAPATIFRRKIEQVYELPALPIMAQKLLELHQQPEPTIEDLSAVVELAPSLAAQVIRYARSPFFGYRGEIKSIHHAIARVLGVDMVLNMALGIAAAGSLHNPFDGPLGLRNFWRHAAYTGALAQALVPLVTIDQKPRPGVAYLAGLLHNFGFLLLGHMFQSEFFILNRLVAANPDVPITTLEKHVLEMGHAEIGKRLMQSWNMPPELVTTVAEHHNATYEGQHWQYSRLILCANHLLKMHDIGDADSNQIPSESLKSLGIDEAAALEVVARVLEGHEHLDSMANKLAAA